VGQFILSLYPAGADPPEGVSQIDHAGYVGLLTCRIVLGFFEAGQWPCALVTTQRILTRGDLGNSLLQSGASIGASIAPLIVQALVVEDEKVLTANPDLAATWRLPFYVIGAIGLLWPLPWLWMVRGRDLRADKSPDAAKATAGKVGQEKNSTDMLDFAVRFAVLLVVVIMINMTWQFYRAWLPLFLVDFHHYSATTKNYFNTAFYIAADAGCISAGFLTRWLSKRGWSVHTARVASFTACTALTSLSAAAAFLPKGPLLLGLLLLIGFGALGLFPNYYSFTQDLSKRHAGKVTGILGAATWVVTAFMQKRVGRYVDETGSYQLGILCIGLAPVVACVAIWLFWRPGSREKA
jgi:ACS family hexuronate transporter-like MFS transporter